MAKVKFNEQDIRKVEINVRAAFNKVIQNNQMLNEIGGFLVEDIVTQTRNEKSVVDMKDLRLLKESWITKKKWLIKQGTTPDEFYDEGKSNLTFTGQLLRSLKHFVIGPGRIDLKFEGMHKPYTGKNGKPYGKQMENQTLAKYVAEQGRPFVGVRPAMRLRVIRTVKAYMKRVLIVNRLFGE